MSTGIEEGKGDSLLAPEGPAGVGADSLGLPAFVWLSEQGVEVRFASSLADGTDIVERVLVGPGEGKSALQFANAGEAIGIAWQEVSDSGHGVIKLRGVSPDSGLIGTEITVGGAATNLSHHSLSISGYQLGSEATGAGPTSGLNLVWVASDATDAPGVGRIMMQRFGLVHGEDGSPGRLIPIDVAGQASDVFRPIAHQSELEASLAGAANDNAAWVGDEDGSGGAMGRLPTVATLDTGDVLVAWIGAEGHVHGKLYATTDGDGSPTPDYGAVNQALADLTPHYGRDGDGQNHDARRVKVGDLGPGNFALVWMVAAGADAMLNGSLFSLHADEALGHGASADWTQTSLAPVALPTGFTGEFSVAVADGQGSDLVLSYEVADSAGNVTSAAVAQKFSTAPDAGATGKDAHAELEPGSDRADMGLPVHKAAFNGTSTSPFSAPEQHDSFAVDTNSLAQPATSHPGAASGLIVTAADDGLAAMWMVAGSSADAMGVRLKIFAAAGASSAADDGSVIDVTDSADPHVTPAVARVGDGGVVVAWVEASTGELRAQSYTAHGDPEAAPGGMTVASGHKVSDLALAANSIESGPATAAYANEFALAWVEDADVNGYGSIMLQRYWLQYLSNAAEQGVPVALGRDGHVGDNDSPEQFSLDTGTEPMGVVGRAPQLAGLLQGQLAMSWVENVGSEETVKGAVIERDGGREILNIDLSAQLNEAAVVAKGTHPILSSAANGDILVAWVQPDADGSYDIKAALYKIAGDGVWSLPDKVLELQHLSSQPKEFSLGFSGEDDASLLLTWETDSSGGSSSAWGQRFDLDGIDLGARFNIRDGHADVVSDTTSLPDGNIVVVYAEQDKSGNVDIEAHVVGTGDNSGQTLSASDASALFGAVDTHAGLGDYGSLSNASPLANDKDITVVEDATDGVIIDVLNEQIDAGLRVVQVNGADLAMGAPLRVEHGFVQLRDDGDLLFTADEHFHGSVSFEYTVANDGDQLATASVAINVTPVEDNPMPVDLAFDLASDTSGASEPSPVAPADDHHAGSPDQPPPDQVSAPSDQPPPDQVSAPSDQPSPDQVSAPSDDDKARPDDDATEHKSGSSGGGAHETSQTDEHDGDAQATVTAGPGTSDDREDGAAAQASSSGMDEANDTLNFAARYEHGYRPGSVERQWLRLDDDTHRTAASDAQWPGQDPDAPAHDNDTFVFHAAFGNDAAAEARGVDHVIDLSKSGYPTFQALQDAGALVQVGEDVQITLNMIDPTHPEKILLRAVSLSTLTATDFKFS